MNSKTALWIAITFQCALLVLLSVRLTRVEAAVKDARPSTVVAEPAAAKPERSDAADHNYIRTVIRSELAPVLARLDDLAPTQIAAAPIEAKTQKPALTPKEAEQRVNEFNTAFNNAVASGAVSASQIANIEQKIARLPPSERKRALSMLSRALSNGSIDAPL